MQPPQKPLPSTIYRYSKLDEYFYQQLISNELWFSRPTQFNDPYDCNICFAYKPPEKERKKKVVHYTFKSPTPKKLESAAKKNINKYLKKSVSEINENQYLYDLSQNLINNQGLCCFSSVNDNLLMWSHYANSHKGVCVGYDVELLRQSFPNSKIASFGWVQYGKRFPKVDFIKNELQSLNRVVRYKSIDWEYEKEIRIMSTPGPHSFKPDAIKEVIFGLNTPKLQINTVMALLLKNFRSLSISKVEIMDGEYRIRFSNIVKF